MTPARITELLAPFHTPLGETGLQQISTYIDLLLRWNTRINLTAIRQPEEIVTRHFGESLFAAKHLFPIPTTGHVEMGLSPVPAEPSEAPVPHVIDVGSGPGFPGLPIKIWNPSLHLTLIESNQKKATFLREVIRTFTLTDVNVFPSRAENHPAATADVATLRAIERFDQSLPSAARLVTSAGRLALLIGSAQVDQARALTPSFNWERPIQIPTSESRFLLIGTQFQG